MKRLSKFNAVILSLVLAVIAVFCGFFMTACKDDNGGNNGDNADVNESGSKPLSLTSSVVTNDSGENVYTINAVVTPNTLTPRWALAWVNSDSEWASGKNVNDYISLELSNGDKTAKLSVKQAFGETAVLTSTIGSGANAVSVSKKIDYSLVETYELSADGTYYSVKEGRNTDCYTIGILSEYNGLPVRGISSRAFYNCVSLEYIAIPDSINKIGGSAFFSCSSLKSIVIPSGVTKIDVSTFNGCISLTSVILPTGLTYIDNLGFCGCSLLPSIIIPASVTRIGAMTFQGCTSLKNVTFLGDKSKITFELYAFKDCPYQP